MPSVLSTLAAPQSWPVGALVFLLTVAVVLASRIVPWTRPSFPSKAPRLLKGWPIIGSTGFFRARCDFLKENKARDPSGQFSFYYGPHPIVALSGTSARLSFYTSRGLDLSAGFSALFAAAPSLNHLSRDVDMPSYFLSMFRRFLHKDWLSANIDHLTSDTNAALTGLQVEAPIDPFDVMIKLIYQMTHRNFGSHDIAQDPKLLQETLAAYGRLDNSSGIDVMFPKLPTPNRLRRMWAGAKLYWTFQKIISERVATGRSETDALQVMMDQGDSDIVISSFIIGALFAGLINSGFNAAWILCFLSEDPVWYARMQQEVDAAVAKHRVNDTQSPTDILRSLTLEDWESEFPLIDLGLKDSIRMITRGIAIRKNISGKDISIGNTGQVIPKEAFAVYTMDDVHMDEKYYKNPKTWDPSRYLPGREEDRQSPHTFLGWGSGLHPCLGMRFARLEITITTAMFISSFDFARCDKHGKAATQPLPTVNRNAIGTKLPDQKIFLKLTPRCEGQKA
ncbi:hypothetical protein CDD81_6234 [Ophiocordyceps australis]|uniref:Cytochrome P450 n=1 Tax=Ophiocordyceps australis TaxID=1399860 RepID=A0A2C5Y6C8_9HYPO|nr:hypothetical protein CDD81_6234 [Ophiocordyceps australis]